MSNHWSKRRDQKMYFVMENADTVIPLLAFFWILAPIAASAFAWLILNEEKASHWALVLFVELLSDGAALMIPLSLFYYAIRDELVVTSAPLFSLVWCVMVLIAIMIYLSLRFLFWPKHGTRWMAPAK